MSKVVRRTAEPVSAAPPAQPKPAAALATARDGLTPTASPTHALQDRLNQEFGAQAQAFPEPVVEPWSPAVQMLIVLGGGAMLWSLLAAGARLALH